VPVDQITAKAILPRRPLAISVLLLAGFAVSLLLRLSVGGVSVTKSSTAGLVFGCCLFALSLASGLVTKFNSRPIIIGVFGGAALCIPAFFAQKSGIHPYGNYLSWALVVSFVAVAEEAFFRGVLFDSIREWKGETAAIFIAAAAFTILHVPLYGWHVVPLDFAVGAWLGSLRAISGSWIAPGISHALADLAGWWI
jgi:membrane protease YdiL (CAAX protease family)